MTQSSNDAFSTDTSEPLGDSAQTPGAIPVSIGPFRIVKRLGAGGTGSVFLGERSEHFQQRVAIKTLLPRFFAGAADASLEHEAQVLLQLNHPNIVRFLDCAVTQAETAMVGAGSRYLVMEYVEGVAIDVYCDRHRLKTRQRVELLVQAMDAVEYAHQRLVVHSDLKPSHILVSEKMPVPEGDAATKGDSERISDEGKVKLLDFGVATLLSTPGVGEPAPFTPAFASPEQRRGEPVTVLADVYALGAITSLILTGVLPAPAALTANEWQEAARGESPVDGYRKLDGEERRRIAEARGTTATGLRVELRGDLEAVLEKAMRWNPEERYASVAGLSGDLRNYLYALPVSARTASPPYLARKWVLRHKLAAGLAMASILLMVLSAVGVVWQAASATRQRQIAETRLHELVGLTGTLDGELYTSVDPLARSQGAKDLLLAGATRTLDTLAVEDARDTVLDVELAQQYERLARLRIARNPRDPEAVADLLKGIAALGNVPYRDPQHGAAAKQLARLEALQQAIAH
jgi:serine/threonine-protein kinase